MNAKKIYPTFEGSMTDDLGKRIDLFLRGKGITRAEFGRECGTSGTTSVTNYIDGKSKPNAEFVALAAKKFDINPLWLLLGQGPMTLAEAIQECPSQAAETPANYGEQVVELKHRLADQMLETARMREAMGKQQSLIFEAVRKACRDQGLTADQTRALQWAVMDYEGSLDATDAAPDAAVSHQKAVGD